MIILHRYARNDSVQKLRQENLKLRVHTLCVPDYVPDFSRITKCQDFLIKTEVRFSFGIVFLSRRARPFCFLVQSLIAISCLPFSSPPDSRRTAYRLSQQ